MQELDEALELCNAAAACWAQLGADLQGGLALARAAPPALLQDISSQQGVSPDFYELAALHKSLELGKHAAGAQPGRERGSMHGASARDVCCA